MDKLAPFLKAPLDFGAAQRNIIGLPPAIRTPRVVVNANTVSIAGIPLAVVTHHPAALAVPSQAQVAGAQPPPTPTEDKDLVGEAITIPVVFAGAGEIVALRRPQGKRIALLIQNFSVVGSIFYCFDRTADNTTCVAITAGNNRDFDKGVPQGDLHIFSSGAGTVIVEYINKTG